METNTREAPAVSARADDLDRYARAGLWALPVWGVWSDDRPGFAFSCAPGSRKAANIAANPQVCVMPECGAFTLS